MTDDVAWLDSEPDPESLAEEARADELPGGQAYADAWTELERDGGRHWRNATAEEKIQHARDVAVSRRRQQEQAERLGYASIDDYLAAMVPRPPLPGAGIDAADLLALDLPPLRWIVPDVLPEGTTVIAAPPKVGKSSLVYQIAVEVAIGGDLLGRRVAAGSALYLALEDGQRRGQARLRAALAGRTMPRGRLEVRWSARKTGGGLEDDLAAWLDTHRDAALVAIDTLGKVRPRTDGRRNAYEVDVEDLGRLQDLFRDRDVALVIVHHARKALGDDFLASVSGTYGVTGSVDTIIAVKRPRLEAYGSILVTGRDVPDAEIPVRFDGMTWAAAPASLGEASFERLEVLRVIEAQGPLFPKAIADALGRDSETGRIATQNLVKRLVDAGAVMRTQRGYVAVAAEAARANLSPHDSRYSRSNESNDGHPRDAQAHPREGQLRVSDRMAADIALDEPEDVDEPEDLGGVVRELFPDPPVASA